MAVKLSVNIEQDALEGVDYQVTANAKHTVAKLWQGYDDGVRAFNLIGSYGSGKSAFLWALQSDLKGSTQFFNLDTPKLLDYLPIVGDVVSLMDRLAEALKCEANDKAIFKSLKKRSEQAGEDGMVLLQIDEMGKHLEYAAKHDPEQEIYFMQKLAEVANRKGSNLLLVTTLHQSFDAYANKLKQATRNEWEKVKGRFRELSFNETPEALLGVAAAHIQAEHSFKLNTEDKDLLAAKLLDMETSTYTELASNLYPLDVLTAKYLVQAFQRYGQNNRSLFSFLKSTESDAFAAWKDEHQGYYHLDVAFDYLYNTFFHYLTTTGNKDYLAWKSILDGMDRVNTQVRTDLVDLAAQCLRVVGFARLFAPKGAKINDVFIKGYFKKYIGVKGTDVEKAIAALSKAKVLRYRNYEDSYAIVEGTDLDIDNELVTVGERLSTKEDLVTALKRRIDFAPIAARRISFETGTPRFFELIPSEAPYLKAPSGEVDGFVNLLFNESIPEEELKGISKECAHATLFAHYTHTERIKNTLLEIEKVEQLLLENEDDFAAVRELKKIKEHQELLLKVYVEEQLTSNKVDWYFNGKKFQIGSRKELNQELSRCIEQVYAHCPVFRNELINRHKLSGSIGTAKKAFFNALAAHWQDEHLGFDENKFPPEKTIFLSLLKYTGIQNCANGIVFQEPEEKSFHALWRAGLDFIESASTEAVNVQELFDTLKKAPYGIKHGFLEVWLPTFLFIHRDRFALYEKNTGFQPALNGGVLNMLSRNPKHYEIKSFQLEGVRLNVFNRYREFLQLSQKERMDSQSFIESIKPFLVFYKGLNPYAQKTKRLSPEAIAFRQAIAKAKDPEHIFFEAFPKALGYTVDDLNDHKALEAFAAQLKDCAQELNTAYDALLDRLEAALKDVLFLDDVGFSQIQELLAQRYAQLQERFLTLTQKQFLARVKTPIRDRASWYASIFQPLAGKSLEQISDQEEQVLIKHIAHTLKELDNLVKIHQEDETTNEELIKLDLTFGSELKEQVVRVPTKPNMAFTKKEAALKELLQDKPEWNLAVLAKLLREELENDKS